jgi:hypothetical protein
MSGMHPSEAADKPQQQDGCSSHEAGSSSLEIPCSAIVASNNYEPQAR